MAIKMMSPDCYLASIDLNDAYYSVPFMSNFASISHLFGMVRCVNFVAYRMV